MRIIYTEKCMFDSKKKQHSKSRKMTLSKDKFDADRRNPYSIMYVYVASLTVMSIFRCYHKSIWECIRSVYIRTFIVVYALYMYSMYIYIYTVSISKFNIICTCGSRG